MRLKQKIVRVTYSLMLLVAPILGMPRAVSADPGNFFVTFDAPSVKAGQQDVPVYVHMNSNGSNISFAGCELIVDATEATFSHGADVHGGFSTDFGGPNDDFDAGGGANQRLFFANDTSGVPASSNMSVYVMFYDITASASGTINIDFDTPDTSNCLINDDTPAAITTTATSNSLDVSGVTVTESGGSTDVVENGATDTYDVVLDAEPASNVTINVTDDSQVDIDKSSLVFTNANWDTPQTVTVSAQDDAAVEGAHTGAVTMSVDGSSDPLYTGLTVNSVVANVTDDDGLIYEFTNGSASSNENVGGSLPQVVVSGGVTASAENVDVTVTGGTATGGGDDYSFTDPETIVIPAGNYASPTTFSITSLSIQGDTSVEPDETITLGFNNASSGLTQGDANGNSSSDATHTYTIVNDDGVLVELSTSAASDNENSGGNVPSLVVSGGILGSSGSIDVNILGTSTADGSDYTSAGTTVTVPAGDYSSATAIPIGLTINSDTTIEADDTIDLDITNPSNISIGDADGNSILTSTSTYTITNDDQLQAELTDTTASDTESSGGNVPQILVNGTSDIATTIRIDDQGTGSATSGSDYTLTDPVDVAVPAATYDGTTGTAISVPFSVTNDQNIESSETVDFDLVATESNTVLFDVDTVGGIESSHTYTITDDDQLDVEFDVAADSADEDASYTALLRVGGAILSADGSIEVTDTGSGTATGGGDDYTFSSPQNIVIPMGDYSSGTTTINVTGLTITSDGLIEPDETIIFGLQNPSSGLAIADADGADGTESSLTHTITNDDGLLVEFTSASASDNEDTGGNLPQVVVSGADTTGGAAESVGVTVTGGTATGGGDDYTFTTDPETIAIPAGDYTSPVTFSLSGLTIGSDSTVEPNETITFGLTALSGGLSNGDANGNSSTDSTHTYTINNDDGLLVEFSDTTASDVENSGGNVPTLIVSNADTTGGSASSIDVNVLGSSTADGSDYTLSSTTITIPAADYSSPVAIPIGLTISSDTTVENDDVINMNLSTPVNVSVGDADGADGIEDTHSYTITNDDLLAVEFSTTTASDAEASGGNIPTVFVNGTSDVSASVTIDDLSTGTATNGSDYTFTDPTTVAIPAGTYDGTTATDLPLSLTISDDSTVEPDETIILSAVAATNVTIADADGVDGVESAHTYTITNDDTTSADTDNDGITDVVENAGPNGGDANGDSILDSTQPSVASLVNSITGAYNVLEITTGCTTVASYAINTESSQSTEDAGFDFPQGLNDFTLTCGSSGESATVTIILDQIYDTSVMTVRKLNRNTSTYSEITSASFGTRTVGSNTVTTLSYSATDGAANDEDATANATIVDPVGVAVVAGTTSETGSLEDTGRNVVIVIGTGIVLILATQFIRRRTFATSRYKIYR